MGLDKLKELTDKVVSLSSIVKRVDGDVAEFNVMPGIATILNLMTNEHVHVSEMYMSAGTVFPPHVHSDAVQYSLPYKGELIFNDGGEIKHVKEGCIIRIDQYKAHNIRALTDTNIILITVPAIGEVKSFFGDGRK